MKYPINDAPIRIVILPAGWVIVGRLIQDDAERVLYNAAVIRIWGTSRGLGEIAEEGPTDKTVLDPCGTFRWQRGTEIGQIDCAYGKWNKVLK